MTEPTSVEAGAVSALAAVPQWHAWVALGANLGEPGRAFAQALDTMRNWPGTALLGVSALYDTAPWQAQGPRYTNAVAVLATALGPQELLRAMLALELQMGRERPYLHAPRPLDLDLLALGDHQCDTPCLTLPHPRALSRAFVLAPWAELASRCPGLTLPWPLPGADDISRLCEEQGAKLSRAGDWYAEMDR